MHKVALGANIKFAPDLAIGADVDLLRSGGGADAAWSPAYSVLECVRAVRVLLACPEPASPLNVDAAALLRAGDAVGARRLVELFCREERYEGA